ncbi:sigma-70 family RNA polymerase sigma factor [Puia dinghuensis]|uniref:RNA polymerase sigma factor SigJ n=1 Tax=Puia dinghuensis TaxID=1792502 RepID=A0A8J2UDP1_9BACT|nr:sigma-70 family RNA polymerase sigma factor [Puia dinghuensis]GGB02112.1 RNA polymerase sigma factor SigJ [Puia dinghuensis]
MSYDPSLREAFLAIRPRLFALAYRMTKSVVDAEDIVHDVFLAAEDLPADTVREPEAYLVRIATNRCLAVIKAKEKDVYPGPDLPEPLVLDRIPGLETMDLSYGLLVLLQRLSAMERAVFVLRETMGYSYSQIADCLSINSEHCRQLQHRAKLALSSSTRIERTSPEQLQQFLAAFVRAASSGEISELLDRLHEDIVIQADGGGKRPAALKPITGKRNCVAYLTGLYQKWSAELTPHFIEINGEAGLVLRDAVSGEPYAIMLFHLRDHHLADIYMVHNPNKMSGVQKVGEQAP